jgi:hypothetical protein
MSVPGRFLMDYSKNHTIFLARMDKAFGIYSQEAEKLSVMLGEPRDPSSWSSYHEIMKQRVVEASAYEQYRKIQDELFTLISPAVAEQRRESSIA